MGWNDLRLGTALDGQGHRAKALIIPVIGGQSCVSVTAPLNARECSVTNRYSWQGRKGEGGMSRYKEHRIKMSSLTRRGGHGQKLPEVWFTVTRFPCHRLSCGLWCSGHLEDLSCDHWHGVTRWSPSRCQRPTLFTSKRPPHGSSPP